MKKKLRGKGNRECSHVRVVLAGQTRKRRKGSFYGAVWPSAGSYGGLTFWSPLLTPCTSTPSLTWVGSVNTSRVAIRIPCPVPAPTPPTPLTHVISAVQSRIEWLRCVRQGGQGQARGRGSRRIEWSHQLVGYGSLLLFFFFNFVKFITLCVVDTIALKRKREGKKKTKTNLIWAIGHAVQVPPERYLVQVEYEAGPALQICWLRSIIWVELLEERYETVLWNHGASIGRPQLREL